MAVDSALRYGRRGLPGEGTLARLLVERRGVWHSAYRPALGVPEILAWADAFHARAGRWPTLQSGPIAEAPGETWLAVNAALDKGFRGLAPGSSLARLLARERGARNNTNVPPLSIPEILRWAEAHRERHGTWPTIESGSISEAPGETWDRVDNALCAGVRGLVGGSSLPRLLAAERGARNSAGLPPLTVEQILAWADAHHARTGRWPTENSGPIPKAPGETWRGIKDALSRGHRGQPGGSSVARLLARERGVRNSGDLPALSISEILGWADAHREREGAWPTRRSGPIPEAPGETWGGVDTSLQRGHRGLPGGSSLPGLLAAERRVRNTADLPTMTEEQVLAWADAHHARTGRWPTDRCGPIPEAPGETWSGIRKALSDGSRGFPGGSSLARLLFRERGVPNHMDRPRLSMPEVLRWADAYRDRHGAWPCGRSGPIPEAPGETWGGVATALQQGRRGLPGGSSLARLLARERGADRHAGRQASGMIENGHDAGVHARRSEDGIESKIQDGSLNEPNP